MDGEGIEQATRGLAGGVGTRRAALRTRLGIASVAGLATPTPDAGAARRRPKRTYTCPAPDDETRLLPLLGFPNGRQAQLFEARRDGVLRQIRVGIEKLAGGAGDDVVQLGRVAADPTPLPSNSPFDVIAAVTIPDEAVRLGQSTVVAAFAGTPIRAQTAYAVVVARLDGADLYGLLRQDGGCPGRFFEAESPTGPFLDFGPGFALVVSVLVA